MIRSDFVEMLVRKIKNAELNPLTNKPFALEDIKLDEYKIEVENKLKEGVIK